MTGAGRARFWTAAAVLTAALALVPILSVLWSFTAVTEGSGGRLGHLASTILPVYARNSALLMVLVGAGSIIVGVGTAWLVSACAFRGRRMWSWLLVLPIAAPAYIIAYLYTELLSYSGPVRSFLREAAAWASPDLWFPDIRSLPGAALMLSLVLYPYVYLLARAAFAAQSRSQFLAARSLGLSPARVFFRVALPSARPAIVGGAALVMMETLADFGVADYFAIQTFSTGIFRTWFALGDQRAAMQLAGVMLSFVVLLVALEASTRRGRYASGDRISAGEPPFILNGWRAAAANLACAVPVILGFAIPFLLLLVNIADQRDAQPLSAVAGFALSSIGTAGLTAAIATVLSLVLVYAARNASGAGPGGWFLRSSVRVATLGYALPGALLAVGLLGPLGSFDRALTLWLRDTLGWQGGLVLTGTILTLTYALVIRFLTVSFNTVQGGMAKVSPTIDAAARSLGASPGRVIRRVHLPLLRANLAVSASLVFVDVMRELPVTLILRPFNFETLATRVYRLASDERIVEASTPALLIVLVGIVPVFVLNAERKEAR